MPGTETMSLTPLSTNGVDFNNNTQAMDFLGSLLDDTVLQVIGNHYAIILMIGSFCAIFVAVLSYLLDCAIRQLR